MERQDNGMGVGSLVCGILGFITALWGVGLVFAVLAIILGHVHKSHLSKEPARYTGDGLATAGLICGYITFAIALIAFLFLGSWFALLAVIFSNI